ncbi:DUF4116 domain-containing protein [Paraburkholderia aromaticivorans]|uniref:DUF4116 domain-containing protein n=1 Tax=Paraburkholderia aromaticivorans TaxID=2026199 RepID=UPI0038B6C8EB
MSNYQSIGADDFFKLVKDPNTTPAVLKEVTSDSELAKSVVADNPQLLKYFDEGVRNNDSVVLQAIKEDGTAIEHASNRIKDSKTMGTIAVRQDGNAFKHLSENLRNDPEIAVFADIVPEDLMKQYIGNSLKEKIGNAPVHAWLEGEEAKRNKAKQASPEYLAARASLKTR